MKKNTQTKELNLLNVVAGVELLKTKSQEKQRKFIETLDIAINLNIDPRQSNQNLRGAVALPAGTGRDIRIIVFTDNDSLKTSAIKAGALKAGMAELMQEIEEGFLGFDYCIATPDVMKGLSKVAKKLGPRGLMPNPKNGNITNDVVLAIQQAKKGKVNLKNDKFGIVHSCVGKINFNTDDLISNIKAIVNTVKELKPEGSKGKYIKSIYLSTTMGPSVAIELDNI